MCETGMATLVGTLGFRTVFWKQCYRDTQNNEDMFFGNKKKKLDSIKVKVRTRS